MKISRVYIQGYTSYQSMQSINIAPASHGLGLIRGDSETLLGSNGVGKSSIINAINWCLFNETLTGLKGGAISPARQGGLDTQVTVDFMYDDVRCEAIRSLKPSNFIIGPLVNQQKAANAEEFLGCTAQTFAAVFAAPQRLRTIFDMTPMEQQRLLEGLVIDRLYDHVVPKLREAERIAGDKEHEARVKEARCDEQIKLRSMVEGEDPAPLREQLKVVHAKQTALEKEMNQKRAREVSAQTQARQAQQLVDSLKGLERGQHTTCTLCGQTVGRKLLQGLRRKAALWTQRASDAGAYAFELVPERSRLGEKERALSARLAAAEGAARARGALSPLGDSGEADRARWAALAASWGRRAQRARGLAGAWPAIRREALAMAAEAIVGRVAASLPALGLEGWRVQVDVGRAGKGIVAQVIPPGLRDSIPWPALSGGEAQRLRIAACAALMDMASAMTGFELNIEAWDEPTAHLTDEGVSALLSFLRERSSRKMVWLIDHRLPMMGAFDYTLLVHKHPSRGSKVRMLR